MTEPTYRHGTAILAEGGPYSIEGRLLGDHETLDGLVHVLTADGECLTLNGWMFAIEITGPPPGRRPRQTPDGSARRLNSATNAPPTTVRRRPSYWSRPWWKRQYHE